MYTLSNCITLPNPIKTCPQSCYRYNDADPDPAGIFSDPDPDTRRSGSKVSS